VGLAAGVNVGVCMGIWMDYTFVVGEGVLVYGSASGKEAIG